MPNAISRYKAQSHTPKVSSLALQETHSQVKPGALAVPERSGFINYGVTFSLSEQKSLIMDFQRNFSPSKSMRCCGRTAISGERHTLKGYETINGDLSTGWRGTTCCKAILCPSCGPSIVRERNRVITNSLVSAQKLGYTILFLTLTTPKGLSLSETNKILNTAYSETINKGLRGWLRRRGCNVFENVRGMDLTINDNRRHKYHTHIHAALVLSEVPKDLKKYIWKRYKNVMKRLGMKVSQMGFDLQEIEDLTGIENYIVKSYSQLGYELTSKHKSSNKSKGVSFWIRDNALSVSKKGIAIYQELLRETKGLRWFSTSKGFKGLSILEDEVYPVEEEKVEIYSVDLSLNLYYAILEVPLMRIRVEEWLLDYLKEGCAENKRYKGFLRLINCSQFETKLIHHNVDYYKEELIKIRDR